MAQFEELQTLWQNQAALVAKGFDPAAISNAFRRYGRRQDLINGSKAMAIVIALVLVITKPQQSPLAPYIFGIILFTATMALWYRPGTLAPVQWARPTDATTRLSSSMKPGNGRPIHSLLVMVVRVASRIAARPIASATARIVLGARGVLGKLSGMPAPRMGGI